MKLAIVGSRGFSDFESLKNVIDAEKDVELIVSGGAKGADSLAERYASERGIPVKIFLPDWDTHGKQAGFIRNQDIVRACDKLIAFWDGDSRGTSHSIHLARSLGKPVKVIRYAN